MANPTAAHAGTLEGVWLLPLTAPAMTLDTTLQVWVATMSPDLFAERSVGLHKSPTRQAKVSRAGILHLDEGTLSGPLRDGYGVTGDQWLTRLRTLIEKQHRYHVYLASPRYYFRCELNSLSKQPVKGAGPRYQIQVQVREVT